METLSSAVLTTVQHPRFAETLGSAKKHRCREAPVGVVAAERAADRRRRVPGRFGGQDRPVALLPRGTHPAGPQRAAFPFGQPAPDPVHDPVGDGVVQARLADRARRADLPRRPGDRPFVSPPRRASPAIPPTACPSCRETSDNSPPGPPSPLTRQGLCLRFLLCRAGARNGPFGDRFRSFFSGKRTYQRVSSFLPASRWSKLRSVLNTRK